MEKLDEAYKCTVERGPMDQRQWTPQHLQAANMAASLADPTLLALTPPQGDDLHGTKDVDVRGPGERGFCFVFIGQFCRLLHFKKKKKICPFWVIINKHSGSVFEGTVACK